MTVTEKAAYIKGLIDGLNFDSNSAEGKVFTAISGLLSDMALEIEDLNSAIDELDDAIGVMDEDIEYLEECLFNECDDDDCDCGCCGENLYTVKCPSCGDEITLDESMIEEGSVDCPGCGELLEFDDDCDCDCCGDDNCDCGCDHDHK